MNSGSCKPAEHQTIGKYLAKNLAASEKKINFASAYRPSGDADQRRRFEASQKDGLGVIIMEMAFNVIRKK